ncbi:MAG: UvrB/UvrC motif-containing protein [Verrucomicrobiales bacterium]|nr:UvrB/UvrC motif-containing protein [Verrucomicrobiales bacterium]
MNCDVCQSEDATIFFSQVVEGKLQKVNLCKPCADEKGVTDPTGFALADMLEGMGEEQVTETVIDTEELICPGCGFTQTDFKKTGRFGCADCYHVFDEGLEGLLEAMHKHTQHVGKVPATFPDLPPAEIAPGPTEPMEPSPLDRLSELKNALSKSVEDEDYEEAARLRDEISQLESQVGDS